MRPVVMVNGEQIETRNVVDDATLSAFVGNALVVSQGRNVDVDDYEVRREDGSLVELVDAGGCANTMVDLGMRDGETLYVTRPIGVGA